MMVIEFEEFKANIV